MKKWWQWNVVICCCAICLLLVGHSAAQQASPTVSGDGQATASATIPHLVRFTGGLKDAQGQPLSGVVGITFALYKDQEGGAPLWMEVQNLQLDSQGHYTALLGASKAEGVPLELFSANQAQWLGVQPEGQAEQRILLVSVPYALKAADAETLGGIPASSFVLAAPTAAGATTSTGPTGTTPTATGALVPSPAISGSGTVNTLAKFDASTTNLVSSSITDTGTAVSTTEPVGIGTASPGALLDVEFTTGAPTNALLSNINYNNSTAVTNAVVSAFDMNFMDGSTAANLSKQTARIAYIREAGATGGVTAFDTALTTTEVVNANAPFPVRSINIEGPNMNTGTTLSNFTGLYIGSPSGAGTVTSKFALVTEPNAGNVGIGTTSPGSLLEVDGNLTVGAGGILTGNGSGLTNLNVSSLSSGTIPAGLNIASTGTTGLYVQATNATSFNTGISGLADGLDGAGVVGEAENGSTAAGVWGVSTSGVAGLFSGNVSITGTMSAANKEFRIDHPLDPANKYLYHASVESSEMMNIYTGNMVLDASGAGVVQLPSWFEALNTDFRYQLTAVGGPGPGLYIAQEIQNGSFRIAGGTPGLKVSWQVTGVRQDAFAKANPLVVEVEKPEQERGYYIHPQLFGQPPTKSIEWAQHPLQMKQLQQSQATEKPK